jgi:polysaccharide biosynthesis transport protein
VPSDAAQARGQPCLAGTPYWRRVLKHRFGIIGLSVVCGLLAALVTDSLDPLYEAEVTILVDIQGNGLSPGPDSGVGGRMSSFDSQTVMRTQVLLLDSRTMAESVSDRLGLWHDPEFDPRQVQSRRDRIQLDWPAWVPDSLSGSRPASPPTEEQARETAIASVRNRLRAEAIPGSQVIRLSFAAHDPRLAARVANAFAEAYAGTTINAALELPGENAARSASSLAERETQGTPPGDSAPDPTGERIAMLSQQLREARARTDQIQDLHDLVQRADVLSTRDLISHPILAHDITIRSLKASELQADREVSELAKRYGPLHPRMVEAQSDLDAVRAMLAAEIGNAVTGLTQEWTTGRAHAEKLEAELAALQTKAQNAGPRAAALPSPERHSETGRPVDDAFATRSQEPAPYAGGASTHARIIDPALVPKAPVYANAIKITGIGALLGFVAGLATAMLSAFRDNTLKDPRDIEDNLQVPMLATIPLTRSHRRKKVSLDRMFADQPSSPFAEAMRTLRTGVVLSNPDNCHWVVLVTSSLRGEGATTVAINLALALGQLDKVLLIDADLRRRPAAGRLGLPADAPGLSDLVIGTAEERACIHPVAGLKLDMLPAGTIPSDPLEVLSSRRAAETLDGLRERYAWIVIDSPAAQAVSDALTLPRKSDAVVLVIRAGETPLPLVQATVKRLRQVGAPLIGMVLNAEDHG